MKTTASVLLLVMAACAPAPAPTATVWTAREFFARRDVTAPIFGGWAPSQLLVTEGQTIPFTTRVQGAFEGLTVFPGVSDGRAVGFVISDIWQDHPEPWVQPVYVPARSSPDGSALQSRGLPTIFPVGLDSTFYSPWWRVELVPLDDAAATSLTSAELVLEQGTARTLGPLVLCPIVPNDRFDVAAQVRTQLQTKPLHPLTGAALAAPKHKSAFVDDGAVEYLDFGPGRAPFNGQRLVESDLFVFVKNGASLPVAAVMPAAARSRGFLRRVEVEVPESARFFVPSNRPDLREPLGELAPAVDARLDAFPAYALRLVRDPACFSSPGFPDTCDWLDSPEKVRALPVTTRREVQLSVAVLDEVTP
ncbi:MAG: hypothetical protein Q8S33_08645 [Myxococcales bacterium]|nr:hypothetical protein [Myxococcales bacterium]